MGQRQEQVDQLLRVTDQRALAHRGGGAVVAVGDHAALRRTGRAGGVDDRAEVVRLDGRDALLELVVADPCALRLQLFERDRFAEVGGVGVDDHDLLEEGELIADALDLVELLLVLDEDKLRLGVVEHVLDLFGRVALVDRGNDCAGAQRAEVGVGPLGTRVGKDCDLVAEGDAVGHQSLGDSAHDRQKFGVGDFVPLLANLVLECGVARVLLGSNA